MNSDELDRLINGKASDFRPGAARPDDFTDTIDPVSPDQAGNAIIAVAMANAKYALMTGHPPPPTIYRLTHQPSPDGNGTYLAPRGLRDEDGPELESVDADMKRGDLKSIVSKLAHAMMEPDVVAVILSATISFDATRVSGTPEAIRKQHEKLAKQYREMNLPRVSDHGVPGMKQGIIALLITPWHAMMSLWEAPAHGGDVTEEQKIEIVPEEHLIAPIEPREVRAMYHSLTAN